MFLPPALCLLLALQWTDVWVSGATLIAAGIHPRTLCCKRNAAIEPLKGIVTMEACKAFCGKLKQKPLQLGAKLFACARPKYVCDQTGVGAQCGACYKAGTCYLIPYVGGIRSSTKTEIIKKQLTEQEQREKVFSEQGFGTRKTGLGGVASIRSATSGKQTAAEKNAAKILTKRVTTALVTENFGGFPKGAPLGPKDFITGSAISGFGRGRIGPNGAIKKTEEIQLADKRRALATNSRLVNKQQENFAQDLSALGPGQAGSFASKSQISKLSQEQAKRIETEKSQTRSKKLALSGTAAIGFGGGPVELLQQERQTTGSEKELRRGTQVVGGRFKESLVLKGGPKDIEFASIHGITSARTDVQKAVRGRTLGREKLRQVATKRGINQVVESSLLGQRQTDTATKSKGKFATIEKRGKKCDHCTSTSKIRTKGQTYGSSQEKLQEQSKKNLRRSLRGRAGQGATVATTGTEVNKFRRVKAAQGGSNVQQAYKGTNSLLSNTGSVRGHVAGRAATRSRKRSFETEEGVSVADVRSLDLAGFPTKVHRR